MFFDFLLIIMFNVKMFQYFFPVIRLFIIVLSCFFLSVVDSNKFLNVDFIYGELDLTRISRQLYCILNNALRNFQCSATACHRPGVGTVCKNVCLLILYVLDSIWPDFQCDEGVQAQINNVHNRWQSRKIISYLDH